MKRRLGSSHSCLYVCRSLHYCSLAGNKHTQRETQTGACLNGNNSEALKLLHTKVAGKVAASHHELPHVQSRTHRLATPRRLNALSRGCGDGGDATQRTHARNDPHRQCRRVVCGLCPRLSLPPTRHLLSCRRAHGGTRAQQGKAGRAAVTESGLTGGRSNRAAGGGNWTRGFVHCVSARLSKKPAAPRTS